jgi:GxxExxY protein
LEHEELTHKIIGCAYKVFNQLGFGFLESVYQKAMLIELGKSDLNVEAEKHSTVYYDNQIVGDFYVDLFVENEIIVELKSVQNLSEEHEVQLVNYLKGLRILKILSNRSKGLS